MVLSSPSDGVIYRFCRVVTRTRMNKKAPSAASSQIVVSATTVGAGTNALAMARFGDTVGGCARADLSAGEGFGW